MTMPNLESETRDRILPMVQIFWVVLVSEYLDFEILLMIIFFTEGSHG